METPKADQTGGWLSHQDGSELCPDGRVCAGMSSVSPSKPQPSPELASGSREQTVCPVLTTSHATTETFLSWLYSYFLAVDGNFRLKLKNRGIKDPELGSGWSYFVENKEYIRHISENTTETEVRTSSSL